MRNPRSRPRALALVACDPQALGWLIGRASSPDRRRNPDNLASIGSLTVRLGKTLEEILAGDRSPCPRCTPEADGKRSEDPAPEPMKE